MTRRQYGTGSVYQRKSDGRWVGTIEAGYTRTGGRRRITVLRKTEAAAKAALKEKQRKIANEGLPEAGLGRATVKAWADVWLPLHERKVRPKTYATDRSVVARWVVPTIGHRRLDELTPGDIRAVRSAITKAGRSTTTAKLAHSVLANMLRAALLEGHSVPARVLEVEPPKKAVNDRTAITVPELVEILRHVNARPDRTRWVAAILLGMRQAEVLGLTWECVDLNAGLLDVSWQLQALPYVDRADKARGFRTPDGYEHRRLTGAWHLTRPKTTKGRRALPLVPWMVTELRAWRTVAPVNPWGLVWSRDGMPVDPRVDRREWATLQVAAGVAHPSGRPYVGHETRHAAATVLHRLGVDPATIEAILGHSSFLTSRGYIHADGTLSRLALEGFAGELGLSD